jgi:hypothetical protein
MKEDKFYNKFTHKIEYEIRIGRDDLEQVLSLFDRLPISQITPNDEKIYWELRRIIAHMKSLDIE